MKTSTKISIGVILLAAIIGVTWIVVMQEPQSKAPMKIGVIAPLTGPVGVIGQYMQEGLLLAQREINERGGIQGRSLELVFEDTIVDPKLSVSAMQKFIDIDNIKVVIGDYRSSNTLAVAPIAEEKKVILISPGSQADSLSEAGDYIFRTQVTAEVEAEKLADVIKNQLEETQVSTIVTNQDYGISFEEKFTIFFKEKGGRVLLNNRAETQETDYRTMLLKSKEKGIDMIVLAVGGLAGGLIANQAKELGLSFTFVASSIIQTGELLEVGKGNVEGFLYVYPYAHMTKEQEVFTQNYKKAYGRENEVIAANSYDALMLAAEAIEMCEEDTSCIKDELYEVKNYSGASGVLSFDENGDVIKPLIIKTVKDGKFVSVM